MRYLGIDYGSKKIGLAVADSQINISTPYKVLENKGVDFIISNFKKIINEEGIECFVIGIPLGLDNTETDQTREVLDFINKLKSEFNIPIYKEDERITSRFADTLLREVKDKKMQDAVAAMLILETFLNKQK